LRDGLIRSTQGLGGHYQGIILGYTKFDSFFFEFLHFLRNDGMEDRYSVLIRLANQLTADGFYCNFNGKKFSPGEVDDELCLYYWF